MTELVLGISDRYGNTYSVDFSDILFFREDLRGYIIIFSKMYGLIGTKIKLHELIEILEDHFNGQN